MKDFTISGKRIKTELIYFLYSLVLAFILNIFSIIKYNTKWSEIYSQLHVVLLLALVIYVLVLVIRIVIVGIKKIFGN